MWKKKKRKTAFIRSDANLQTTAFFKTMKRLSDKVSERGMESKRILFVSPRRNDCHEQSHEDGKQKWEEIRRFSLLRALTLSITHYFLLSARRHTHTVCMSTRFQSTLLKNKLFFSGVRVMMDWFFFPLFSPAFQLPRRQMAAFTMSTLIREWDEPYTSTERHICMGVALPSSLSYLFCLFGFAG